MLPLLLILACWRFMSSGNWENIGSQNWLTPVQSQDFTLTNADLLSMATSENNIQWHLNRNTKILIKETGPVAC